MHFCRFVPALWRISCFSLLKVKAADCSKSSTPKMEEMGFSETWVFIYQTSRVTVASLFSATSLKISSLAKLCSIPHFPLSP